jgi:hypothetical protein
VLNRLSRLASGTYVVSGLGVLLSVCLEGVLGSSSNEGASLGVYLMLGELDLIMIVLGE